MKRRLLTLALALAFCLSLLPAGAGAAEARTVRLGILSDLHYFDYDKLGPQGSADTAPFVTAGEREKRMMAETEGTLNAALEGLQAFQPDAVLVCGDMTSNGEKVNAESVAARLTAAEADLGADFYVINGNHDINNSNAATFNTPTGQAAAADRILPGGGSGAGSFREIFRSLGYDDGDGRTAFYREASYQGPGSLSYVTSPAWGITLIVLDTGIYSTDTSARYDAAQKAGGTVSDDLLRWAADQAEAAAAEGDLVLAMCHHGVVPHYDRVDADGSTVTDTYPGGPELVTSPMNLYADHLLLDNWRQTAETLADAGVTAVFTGHAHCSDVARYTTAAGNTLYDIQTASLAAYPCAYREVTLTQEDGGWTFAIETDYVDTAVMRTSGRQTDDQGNTVSWVKAPALREVPQYAYTRTGLTEDKLGDFLAYLARPALYQMRGYEGPGGEGAEGWLRETAGLSLPWADLIADALEGMDPERRTGTLTLSGMELQYELAPDKAHSRLDVLLTLNVSGIEEKGVIAVDLNAVDRAITRNLADFTAALRDPAEEAEWESNYGSPALLTDVCRAGEVLLKTALTGPLADDPRSGGSVTALSVLNETYQAAAWGDSAHTPADLAQARADRRALLEGDALARHVKSALSDTLELLSAEKNSRVPTLSGILSRSFDAPLYAFSYQTDANGKQLSGAGLLRGLYRTLLCRSILSSTPLNSTAAILGRLNSVILPQVEDSSFLPPGAALFRLTEAMTADHNVADDLTFSFRAVRPELRLSVLRPDAVTALPGQTVTLPVTIANNPGIAGAALTVTYDPAVLTLDAIERGEVFSEGSFTADKATGLVRWSRDGCAADDGTLFTLTFTVSADAGAGSSPVTCRDGTLSNPDGGPVQVRLAPGGVTVAAGSVTVSAADKGLSVRITPPRGVPFTGGFCAAYDQNGRMLGTVSFAPGDRTLSLPWDRSLARTVRAFFLDSAGRPVIRAAECPVQ